MINTDYFGDYSHSRDEVLKLYQASMMKSTKK